MTVQGGLNLRRNNGWVGENILASQCDPFEYKLRHLFMVLKPFHCLNDKVLHLPNGPFGPKEHTPTIVAKIVQAKVHVFCMRKVKVRSHKLGQMSIH